MAKKKKDTSKNRLILGITLLVFGLILVFGKPRESLKTDVSLSDYTFAKEPVKVQGFDKSEQSENNIPKRIIIPKLLIDLEVKRAKIVRGFWEVFLDSAGWGEGSGTAGEAGNQVIFAHAREGLFLPLKNIKNGERIYVLTEDKWYSYQVVEIKEVFPNQTEVIAATDDERLTLYTCSGFSDSKRLIAIAKRI